MSKINDAHPRSLGTLQQTSNSAAFKYLENNIPTFNMFSLSLLSLNTRGLSGNTTPRSSMGQARRCYFTTGPNYWRKAKSLENDIRAQVRHSRLICSAQSDEKPGSEDKNVKYNKEFGYSRKDVILIGVGITALGYGMYYGLQATGMEPGMAGNYVQLFVILGMSLGWIGSYLFRVATKQMTYVKQLEDYEEAVMAKRLQELPEAEMERLLEEVEQEKDRRKKAGKM